MCAGRVRRIGKAGVSRKRQTSGAARTAPRASGRGRWAGDGGPREALWARYALVCVHMRRGLFLLYPTRFWKNIVWLFYRDNSTRF